MPQSEQVKHLSCQYLSPACTGGLTIIYTIDLSPHLHRPPHDHLAALGADHLLLLRPRLHPHLLLVSPQPAHHGEEGDYGSFKRVTIMMCDVMMQNV